MSNASSYQSEIEKKFNEFLNNQGVSGKTISNYCSDVRHFIEWVNGNNTPSQSEVPNPSAFFAIITPEQLSTYRDTQRTSGVPISTINRRLSSVRMLFKWATDAGLTLTNPTQSLRNIINPAVETVQTMEGMLGAFEQSLRKEGAADNTIKNYVSDVQQFLIWRTQQTGNEIIQ